MVKPNSWFLLIEKNEKVLTKHDIVIDTSQDDKSLIVGTVKHGNSVVYWIWDNVIFGRYSIFKLTYLGDDYYFLPEEDVIWIIEENV